MTAHYSFLPWVREGVVSAVQTPDLPNSDTLTGDPTIPIQVELNTVALGSPDDQDLIDVNLRLYGPGDIIGIDHRQIIRTTPQPYAQDFLPNYLATIEFDRPDFPWLFTPAKAEAETGKLRPWLCLIVVRKQAGVSIGTRPGSALPVLEIRDPAIAHQELPDLSESWAWVHSQVIHDAGTSLLETALARQPELTLSRLICPRRLAENESYYACLVPAFEVGRKVGLNLPLSEQEQESEFHVLKPAWIAPKPGVASAEELEFTQSIDLPLYHHWEFKTGLAGDFEDLAQKLKPQIYENLGSRKLYVSNAGIPDQIDLGVVDFTGVFHSAQETSTHPPAANEQVWGQFLQSALQRPEGTETTDPVVGPPVYGQFQRSSPQGPDSSEHWFSDLNLKVSHRAAAGLGVFFAQKFQEELMHSAWEQLKNIQQIQQRQRQRELGKEVTQRVYNKHFDSAVDSVLYQMTAPAHSRLLTQSTAINAGPLTYRGWATEQQVPTGGTTSTFRKLARSHGPIAKRMQPHAPLSQPIAVAIAQTEPKTPFALDPLHKKLGKVRLDLIGQQKLWAAQSSETLDTAALARMNAALNVLNAHLKTISDAAPVPFGGTIKPFDQEFKNRQGHLKNQLAANPIQADDGFISFPSSPLVSIQSAHQANSSNGESLDPPIPHPTFPQAMYEVIQEFTPDFLLPGADQIQDNTVTLLEFNAAFVEAFMLGLNHEMARELLWRNYPTDQRGTYFQNFWTYGKPDLKKIHEWSLEAKLGDTLKQGWQTQTGTSDDQLALIIRGELLRRFPETVIYAVKAQTKTTLSTDPNHRQYPIHRGTLTDDAIFLLFNLDAQEAQGNEKQPGWFFILQQQPTEALFGLDSSAPEALNQWNELSWGHVGTLPEAYLSVAQAADRLTSPPPGATWGFNGAHMAEILLQQPYQLGLHGSLLLPTN